MQSRKTPAALAVQMDAPTLVSIVGAMAVALAALFTGFWKWMTSHGRTSIDAQASVINGFILLLAEFKTERAELVSRIGKLEVENHNLYRHIGRLERAMRQHDVDIPEVESDPDEANE